MDERLHPRIDSFLPVLHDLEGDGDLFATSKDYSAVLRIPIGLYYFSLPLCGFLMLLYASRDVFQLLRVREADQRLEGKEE